MLDEPTAVAAFDLILRDCVDADENDVLLLVFDESFAPYRAAFDRAMSKRRIIANEFFLPRQSQLRWLRAQRDRRTSSDSEQSVIGLPIPMKQALSVCDVVLNFLGSGADTGPMRRAVLYGPRPDDARFAHEPGLTDESLILISKSDVNSIFIESELIAWALGQARQATLITWLGKVKHELHIGMNEWDNVPLMSAGRILGGSWGNLTPGETFCCPDLSQIYGSVVIDGSVPGSVLGPGDELVLEFEEGRLIKWEGAADSPGLRLIKKTCEDARHNHDGNWNVFAELGIGLNPAITELTGSSLFDEKARGTVHVALGDNLAFGHPIHSQVHHDLVVRKPTLKLDQQLLIEHGEMCLDAFKVKRQSLSLDHPPLPRGVSVFLRTDRLYEQGDSHLLRSKRGKRVTLIRMASGVTNYAIHLLIKELETYGDVAIEEFLDEHPHFLDVPTERILALLLHYRVLAISSVPREHLRDTEEA